MSIKEFIGIFRDIDDTMQFVCTHGACYRFALYVQMFYPASELYISPDKQHVCIRNNGMFYDVNGPRSCFGYTKMTLEETRECANWSFSKQWNAGHVCQECGELIEEAQEDNNEN